ncbi:MAG: RNA-binding S4 domain-containing protein [Synergistaceae bacterium]|jgi:ribosomal 50S subunit-recycling heat shock protein|nr:RNA-binding S4 domain-containing protein [Synergistaceae bacterium]
MRVDKFLKYARLVKRRTVAQEMIEIGAVRIDGRVCKSSSEVTEGCVVEVAYMAKVLKVKVLCADEQLLKRPGSVAYDVEEERQVSVDKRPW